MSFDLFKDMSITTGAVWRDPKECSKDAFWHRSFFDGLRAQVHAKFFADETPGKITVTPGEFILTLENASPAQQKAVANEAAWLSLAAQYGIPADALHERYAKMSVPATKSPTDWAKLILHWTLERAIQYCRTDLVLQPHPLTPQPPLPVAQAATTKSTLAEITGRIKSSDIIPFAKARETTGRVQVPPPKFPQPTPDSNSSF